jgi:hypothetical protein
MLQSVFSVSPSMLCSSHMRGEYNWKHVRFVHSTAMNTSVFIRFHFYFKTDVPLCQPP